MTEQQTQKIIDLLYQIQMQLKQNWEVLKSIEFRLPAPPQKGPLQR